jgi:hypothetical protein
MEVAEPFIYSYYLLSTASICLAIVVLPMYGCFSFTWQEQKNGGGEVVFYFFWSLFSANDSY